MAWFSAPPRSLFYTHWKRNGTNILHIITRPPSDTLLLYPPPLRPTYLEPPTTRCLTPQLVRPVPVNNPGRVYITPASSHTSQSTTSLWRWNRYRVPKRRPTTIWHRGNTQKNIFNIQITAKVWNQVYCPKLGNTNYFQFNIICFKVYPPPPYKNL